MHPRTSERFEVRRLIAGAPPRSGRGRDPVRSYYDWRQIEERCRGADIFPVIPETALRATLGILARTVAGTTPR